MYLRRISTARFQVEVVGDRLTLRRPNDSDGLLQYIPLDRISLRPRPRGYKPFLGIHLLDPRFSFKHCESTSLASYWQKKHRVPSRREEVRESCPVNSLSGIVTVRPYPTSPRSTLSQNRKV
eukprot:jgi/Botrbrau1/8809/Bobra.0330s0039.1